MAPDGTQPQPPVDRVVPSQVAAAWGIREQLGAPLTAEEAQLLAALRVALAAHPSGHRNEAHEHG